MTDLDYAGDLSPLQTWELLKGEEDSYLIDCRTSPEWTFVGVPDLEDLNKKVLFLEWQSFPTMNINENFLNEISQTKMTKDSKIILVCRSGGRSRSAAEYLTSYGYKNCYNCCEGFEGSHDSQGHRGKLNGWKFANLPWKQG